MKTDTNYATREKGGAKRMLLLTLPLLMCTGCITAKLNNTDRLISHPEFKSAVIAAPKFVEDALKTIADLEREIEMQ
jgi:hypothetical protein